MKNTIKNKIEFDQDILKVLEKYKIKTLGLTRVSIECTVNDFPIISLIYCEQCFTIKQRIIKFLTKVR